MALKSRQMSLLRDLAQSMDGLSVQTVMSKYGISRRTVYYDVRDLDAWLGKEGLGHVRIENQVLLTDGVQWSRISRGTSGASKSRYLSIEERQAMAFILVALSENPVTIPSLMDEFEVSRNTIIADVRELKDEVSAKGVELSSVSNSGYMVQGDEITIRKLIWGKLQRLSDPMCTQRVRRFLQRTLTEVTGNDIDYFELCRSLIKQYETDLQTRCFLDSNGLEGMMIQVSWLRGLSGHWVVMGRDEQVTLMGTLSYRSVQYSVEKLKNVGIILPSEEMLYITSLLLGIKTTDFAVQSEEDKYVDDLAERLILNFERVGCLTFVNKEYIHEQLSHHIRPLYYRQKYGIPVHNPLCADIQKMYPMTYEFTRRAAVLSGMENLSDDEIAYLTIYLSSDLDSKMLEAGDSSASKVLVVGASNMSTATLVKEQLLDATGISFDFEYEEADKLQRWKFESYALVVALCPLPREMHSENMVEVTPFLTEENKQNIYRVLRSNRIISRYNSLIDGIVRIVGKALPESDREALTSDRLHFELFRFFDERERGLMDPFSTQTSTSNIESEKVFLSDGSTWQEATLAGARALQGIDSSSRLVERMQNIVAGSRFLYYFMAPGVVVVRCPMQGDDNAHVAAQIVLSRDDVEFPDGQMARVIICVATINRYSHWGTLYNVYQYFSDPEHVKAVEEEYPSESNDQKGAR